MTMTARGVGALVAVGLGAAALAGAPAANADTGSTLTFDVGCSSSSLNRGAVPTTGYPVHTVVFLSGTLTGLAPGESYTVVLTGPSGQLGAVETQFPVGASGQTGFDQVSVGLTQSVVDSAPKPYELRDRAGTVVGRGTIPFVARPGTDCLTLVPLSVQPAKVDPAGTGVYQLSMQTDGNIVERDARNRAVWTSSTAGHPGAIANLQTDGNLVIRDGNFRPIWATNTAGHPDATLTLQTDSNVVLRDAAGRAYWSTGIHR